MAARTKKSNTTHPVDSTTRSCCGGIGDHTAECPPALRIFDTGNSDPVDLDPPAPEILRWQELADRDVNIYHEGDASKVLAAPRPAWSDPAEDAIGDSPSEAVYQSAPAKVALTLEPGLPYGDDELDPTRVVVRAFMGHMCEQSVYGIEVKLCRPIKGRKHSDDKPWFHTRMSLTISEARELVEVLQAAIDLIGGEK
jgi:hypothetical protein